MYLSQGTVYQVSTKLRASANKAPRKSQDCPGAAKMVVNGLRYPGLHLVLVKLLNSGSNIAIHVRYQIGAYLIEELSHFFVTAKEVVWSVWIEGKGGRVE